MWGKDPPRLDSTIDVEDVVAKWRSNLSADAGKSKGKIVPVDVRASNDVGNYVCGFVYYASLEWLWKRNGPPGERKVLFLHVPKLEGKADIEKGRDVTIALIKAVIESGGV